MRASIPVHSLLFVKSMPTIKLEDSRPAWASAAVTCHWNMIIIIEAAHRHRKANHNQIGDKLLKDLEIGVFRLAIIIYIS